MGGEKPTELHQGIQTLHERERKSEGGMRRGRSGSKEKRDEGGRKEREEGEREVEKGS